MLISVTRRRARLTSPARVPAYEKAFAQFRGSYGGIEGGHSNEGYEWVSGREAAKLDEDDMSIEELNEALENGVPIAFGTQHRSTGMLWWKEDKDKYTVGDDTLVSGHAYFVESIDMEADPPTVTMRNPWGAGASAPELVTLTWDEIDDNLENLYVGQDD